MQINMHIFFVARFNDTVKIYNDQLVYININLFGAL